MGRGGRGGRGFGGRSHHHRSHGRGGGTGTIGLSSALPAFNLLPFFQPGVINFNGTTAMLNTQINTLGQQQRNSVLYLNLAIQGTKIQQSSPCCFCMTICLGSFFIFPLCFLCCDCYTKTYCQLYNLNDNDYNAIYNAIRSFPNVISIQLHIQDNQINPQKTKIIENALLNTGRTLYFTFRNHAVLVDSNFESLFLGLKATNTVFCTIMWGTSLFITQNFQIPNNTGSMEQLTQLQLYGPKYAQLSNFPQQQINPMNANNNMMLNNNMINNQMMVMNNMTMNNRIN